MSSPDSELDLLLGRPDRVAGPARDRMLDQILGRVEAQQPKRRLLPLWLGGAAAALAGSAALLLAFWAPAVDDGFRARGGAGAAGTPELSLACAPATCRAGGKLLLRAQGGKFFAAAARREDGTLLWYLPRSVAVPGGWLPEGVVLGEEHPPGRYRVYGVFSNEPLDKDGVRKVLDSNAGAVIVERSFEVLAR